MTSTPPASDGSSLTARLDALPFTGEHRKLLIGSGIGWAFDALDVGLISFVIAQLAVVWGASDGELSWIASAGFVGMALGAAVGGLLADRLGRRSVFALTLLIYGLATGASAMAWSVAALVALRLVVGLGLGAELPVASTLVSEFAPPRIRGRIVVLLEGFWAVGWLLAAVVGYLVVPASDDGWRWALAIGALPALYAVVIRIGLPESVRFLVGQGRHAEAEAVVLRFERSAGVLDGAVTPAEPAPPRPAPGRPAGRFATLWSPAYRRRTVAIWVVWFMVNFSYYGAFIWIPSILHASGHTLVRSFGFTLIITCAQLPGYAAAAFAVERWGRRLTLVVFLLGSAGAATFFAVGAGDVQIVTAGVLLSFFNLGAWGALYAATPELYPTALRATGAGWAAGFGRVASIIAPFAVAELRQAGGTLLLFVVFAAAFLVAAAASTALPELRGKELAG